MNKEEINKLTQKIESCWDENNPGDVRSLIIKTYKSYDKRIDYVVVHKTGIPTEEFINIIKNNLRRDFHLQDMQLD